MQVIVLLMHLDQVSLETIISTSFYLEKQKCIMFIYNFKMTRTILITVPLVGA